jgi:hypothetical protein
MKAPSESKGGKLRKEIVRGNQRGTGSVTVVRGLSPFQSAESVTDASIVFTLLTPLLNHCIIDGKFETPAEQRRERIRSGESALRSSSLTPILPAQVTFPGEPMSKCLTTQSTALTIIPI